MIHLSEVPGPWLHRCVRRPAREGKHSRSTCDVIMPKDYKKRSVRRRRAGFPMVRLLVTGMFIAAFAGFLLFIERAPRIGAQAPATPPASASAPSVERPQPQPAVAAPPRFEFYTLLPEKEVNSTSSPKSQPSRSGDARQRRAAPQPSPVVTLQSPRLAKRQNVVYELQVASLKDATEADSLRVKLLLLGFDARIQTATVQRQTWHRVRVGPFRGLDQVNAAKARLERNRFSAMIVNARG